MIRVLRYPSTMAIALEVAPLVRLGVITDREATAMIARRYQQRLAEIRREDQE